MDFRTLGLALVAGVALGLLGARACAPNRERLEFERDSLNTVLEQMRADSVAAAARDRARQDSIRAIETRLAGQATAARAGRREAAAARAALDTAEGVSEALRGQIDALTAAYEDAARADSQSIADLWGLVAIERARLAEEREMHARTRAVATEALRQRDEWRSAAQGSVWGDVVKVAVSSAATLLVCRSVPEPC